MGNSCSRKDDSIPNSHSARQQASRNPRPLSAVPVRNYQQTAPKQLNRANSGQTTTTGSTSAPNSRSASTESQHAAATQNRSNNSSRKHSGGSNRQRSFKTDKTPPSTAPKSKGGFPFSKRKKTKVPIVQEYGDLHMDSETDDAQSGVYYQNSDSEDLVSIDIDLILGTPPDSPSMIHARWGEPMEDPEQEELCFEFKPNPFKIGFCINCQKQHDVGTNGQVIEQKNYKKIALPVVAKTAANAEDNPNAIKNMHIYKNQKLLEKELQKNNVNSTGERESDVDLTAILQQRRDILLKLAEMSKASDSKMTPNDSQRRRNKSLAVSTKLKKEPSTKIMTDRQTLASKSKMNESSKPRTKSRAKSSRRRKSKEKNTDDDWL